MLSERQETDGRRRSMAIDEPDSPDDAMATASGHLEDVRSVHRRPVCSLLFCSRDASPPPPPTPSVSISIRHPSGVGASSAAASPPDGFMPPSVRLRCRLALIKSRGLLASPRPPSYILRVLPHRVSPPDAGHVRAPGRPGGAGSRRTRRLCRAL